VISHEHMSPEPIQRKNSASLKKFMGEMLAPETEESLDLLEDYYNLGIFAFFMEDKVLEKRLSKEAELEILKERQEDEDFT